MSAKIYKQGVQASQAKIRYQTEFDKLVAFKQEYQRVLLETTAPANDTTEPCVLPQPETVADEVANTELSNLLAQEQALQQAKRRLAINFSSNPSLLHRQPNAKRTDGEDDLDLTDKVEESGSAGESSENQRQHQR